MGMLKYRPTFLKRTYIVEKSFQIKFIFKIVAFVIASTVITGLVTYFLTNEALEKSFYSIHYQIKNVWQILLPSVVVISFVTTGVVAFFTTIISLFESHKIGGPLYRFRKSLKEIGAGDLDVVTKLRDSDELQDLVSDINTMTSGIKEKVVDIDQSYNEVKKKLTDVNKTLTSKEELSISEKKLIEELDKSINDLGEMIHQFKYEDKIS